jgi:hypothetical protein
MTISARAARPTEESAMRPKSAVVGVVLLAGLAACADRTETPATTSEMAVRESAVEVTATVEAVNRDTREVMLRTADDRWFTATLGPDVRNFDRIETGDTVRAVFAESVAAEMAAVDAGGEPTGRTVVARAPEGAGPGALVGSEVTTVVTFQDLDPATDRVTFTTPDGLTHSLVLEPEMRDFAAGLEPGDRVQVTYTEAVAVLVEETGG